MWIAQLTSSTARKHKQPKAQDAVPAWLSQKQDRNSLRDENDFSFIQDKQALRHVCTCGPSALVLIRLFTESWPKMTCSCSVCRLLKCVCKQSGPPTGCKTSAFPTPSWDRKDLLILWSQNAGAAVQEAHSPSYWRQILKILYILNIITHYVSLFLHLCVCNKL